MSARVIVGISGASGAALGVAAVEALREAGAEIHLIVSRAGARTLAEEIGPGALEAVRARAHCVHALENVGAAVASGSFVSAGMIVAPCSMRTLAAIAHSLGDNLLTRAADVCLKERRRLVLLTRESPLHLGHIRNMAAATEAGAIIAPPVPAFYLKPSGVEEIVAQIARRAVDLLGAFPPRAEAWRGSSHNGTGTAATALGSD